MEKEYLTSHNIPFVDYNVAADMERRKQMVEMTGQMGVPVTVITDEANPEHAEVMIGFNQSLFEEKLGLNNN
jgi:glutaredoxin